MMKDSKIGGGLFPTTQVSVIVRLSSDDLALRFQATESMAAVYWKPIYKYIRLKWNKSSEDAKDLTQGFFARAIEKDSFKSYDPSRARFRTFVRTCVDGYVSNEEKAAHRIKRGGDCPVESVDFNSAEMELKLSELPAENTMEDYFYKEWVRSLFSMAVEVLRHEFTAAGKTTQFEVFERYDLNEDRATGEGSYESLARAMEIPVSQITNYLAFARREFRRIVLEKLREITANDDEFRSEARWLLGANLK
jgi:DNA-directed RNA polymerase specialized sigma24 family protein